MSMFVNTGNVVLRESNDLRNTDQRFHGLRSRPPPTSMWAQEARNRTDNAPDAHSYKTRWWPRTSQILGGWSGSGDDIFQNKPPQWISPFTVRGANGRLGFVGYTRDQYGSPLGGCTVRLYRTSTEEQQAKVKSDDAGLYFATTPYNDAHFMVIHNAAGDQAGATANTLIPA